MIRSAEAYFGVLRAQEELRLAQSEEKTLRTQLTEIKNRYKLGLMRDTDVFELQAQHDIAKAAVIVAESQLEVMKEDPRYQSMYASSISTLCATCGPAARVWS